MPELLPFPAFRIPGLVVAERTFSVPLDHAAPGGERIEVFAREVRAPGGERRPWLVFLQGGPGFGSPRPTGSFGSGSVGGWVGRAVQDFRVLLLDQRGTARSTPVNRQTLPTRGDASRQADYLTHFRADSIVRDCELIRREVAGDEPWTVLGQSFGGFCATAYLSIAPEGLRRVLICGGLPSLDAHADDVYRAAYPRMIRKNAAYYARYPQDVEHVRQIAAYLATHDVTLPGGMLLTPEAFQSLGLMLGMSDGFERLHYRLEGALLTVGGERALADAFQEEAQHTLSFAGHPIYALLHEPCYAQGGKPTAWSAERVRAEFPEFSPARATSGDAPLLFTGETIHPWFFRTDPALRPLREAADLLAERTEWPALYDADVLAENRVPVAAAVYAEDLYVDAEHSSRTADHIRGLRRWITNEYEHDGLRSSGDAVFERLWRMADGEL
ncbi:alpha/beta fold hydrolase [Actinospica sp.]|jgi:pimeloyl-ACP methyl ester carboxylesterase|uniref:alpha/beta fold hydrolase n=1 Tax=Actinospica sp. TaxID=1872142 RepID=UPI002CC046C3|nr:alpha/beta fold hydrolase [Actinospica sp.]HWG24434.1 alpha/beta fold hydrolase [Actinospica sp.]